MFLHSTESPNQVCSENYIYYPLKWYYELILESRKETKTSHEHTFYSKITLFLDYLISQSNNDTSVCTSAFCCHDGNWCILSEITSSFPLQAHVFQLQLSDICLHGADHLDNSPFAVHGADRSLFHPVCFSLEGTQPTYRHTFYSHKYAFI